MPAGLGYPPFGPNPNVGGSAQQAWLRGGQTPRPPMPAPGGTGVPSQRDAYGMPVISPNAPAQAPQQRRPMDGGFGRSPVPGMQPPIQAPMPPGMAVTPYTQPQGVYSAQQTQEGVNQAVAQAHKAANPSFLLKALDRPGVSRGPAQMAAVLPQYGEAMSQAAMARQTIPWQDEMANQGNLLQGQIGRSNAAQGLAGIGAGMSNAYGDALGAQYGLGQQQAGLHLGDQGFMLGNQQAQQSQLMQLLQQLLGGFG